MFFFFFNWYCHFRVNIRYFGYMWIYLKYFIGWQQSSVTSTMLQCMSIGNNYKYYVNNRYIILNDVFYCVKHLCDYVSMKCRSVKSRTYTTVVFPIRYRKIVSNISCFNFFYFINDGNRTQIIHLEKLFAAISQWFWWNIATTTRLKMEFILNLFQLQWITIDFKF